MPYWTFDAATQSRYTGAKGVHYYETRTVTVNVNGRNERRQEQVQKTRWQSNCSGWHKGEYRDVLVCASKGLEKSLPTAVT